MPIPNPNRLLVEGDEDKRVIPYLMDNFVVWGDKPGPVAVEIDSFNGIDEILKPGVIEAYLKSSGIKSLGVLVDADSDVHSRWERIRTRASERMSGFPTDLPEDGLIHIDLETQVKFGVWLMPDNVSHGMLETFLRHFVPPQGEPIWEFVQKHCDEAKQKVNAPFRESHRDKARIHSWLALQDPPGQSLHLAVLSQTLKCDTPLASRFVKWFCTLFGLPERPK